VRLRKVLFEKALCAPRHNPGIRLLLAPERSRRQSSYGGAVVKGHGLTAIVVAGAGRGDVVAVREAARPFAGFATVGHAHIRGLGTPRPLFVARPPSKVERARPGAGAQATNRGVVCASRDGSDRLASRNGLWWDFSVSW
jgi:hypothetical protein